MCRNTLADNQATAITTILDSVGARPEANSDIGGSVSQLFKSSYTGKLTEILVNHDFLFSVSRVKIQKVVDGRDVSGGYLVSSTDGIRVDTGDPIYDNSNHYHVSNTHEWNGDDAGSTNGSCKKINLAGDHPVLLRNAQYVITIGGAGCVTGKNLNPTNMRVVEEMDGGTGIYKESTVDGSWPKPYPMKLLVDSISITGENDDGNLFDRVRTKRVMN